MNPHYRRIPGHASRVPELLRERPGVRLRAWHDVLFRPLRTNTETFV
ncbi:unnamed protein product [Rhodiola kirilowii]